MSTEGDRINLKSRLSQYISMVRLLDAEFVREPQLVASDPADVERLLRFWWMENRNGWEMPHS